MSNSQVRRTGPHVDWRIINKPFECAPALLDGEVHGKNRYPLHGGLRESLPTILICRVNDLKVNPLRQR
jgi:hypothetical protein